MPPPFNAKANAYFDFTALSHKGWVRANNEDRMLVREFLVGGEGSPVLAAVLCDGVGGHQAGEVAAQIGVDAVMACLIGVDSLEDSAEVLRQALLSANRAVLTAYEENPELTGMAATCVTILIKEQRLFLANLGDSRAYLVRDGKAHQLNFDHTWLTDSIGVEVGVRNGITRDHPLAHVLSRYLGSPQPPEIDLRIQPIIASGGSENVDNGLHLKPGDRLLLCSDGVTDFLKEGQIAENMSCPTSRKSAQKLVLAALEKGGRDNASVIVINL
jgi:protein phosphatase